MKNDQQKILYPNIPLATMFELFLKRGPVAFAICLKWN